MGDKNEFEYADRMTSSEAADLLASIATGIREHKLKLSGKGKSIILLPTDIVKLEIKAEAKEGKGALELEVAWKDAYQERADKIEVSTTVAEEATPAASKADEAKGGKSKIPLS